jgi:hypothetical protein
MPYDDVFCRCYVANPLSRQHSENVETGIHKVCFK